MAKIKAFEWYNETDKIGDFDCNKYGAQEALTDFMNKEFERNKAPCTWDGELWTSGEALFADIVSEYGPYGGVCLFNQYKPERPFRSDEALFQMETECDDTPKCLNKECKSNEIDTGTRWSHCSYGTYITACIENECADLIIAFIVGGWSGLEDCEKNLDINPEVFRFLEKKWDKNYVGMVEFLLYGKVKGKFNGLQVLNKFAISTNDFSEKMEEHLLNGERWFIKVDGKCIEIDKFKWVLEDGKMILCLNDEVDEYDRRTNN